MSSGGDNSDSENGIQAADDCNINMFGEKGATPAQDGGHRQAIEDPRNTKVGVGVSYNSSNQHYYITEDFGCDSKHPTYVTSDNDLTTQHYSNGGYVTHYNDGGTVQYSGIDNV